MEAGNTDQAFQDSGVSLEDPCALTAGTGVGEEQRPETPLTDTGGTHRPSALTSQPATASGALPLPRKPCRVLRRGSVAPLQVVAVAEKGRGNSLVHEKEKGEQSVYIKVGKPHKVDFTTGTKQKCKKQNRKKRMATLIKEMPQLRKST